MLRRASWSAAWLGGYGQPWGSTAMMAIYRVRLGGVLCALILLASVVGLRTEVNTYHFLTRRTIVYAPLISGLCAQETPIELRQSAESEMSSKLSESDQRYKSLGFERTFDGSAGGIHLVTAR